MFDKTMVRGLLSVVIVASVVGGKASGQVQYTVTDLGILPGGTSSNAFGINNSGQVCGGADTTGVEHAFLYSNGVMTDLNIFAGYSSEAFAINSSAQIAGEFGPPRSGTIDAFAYSNGTGNQIAGYDGTASGINGSGQVVGSDDSSGAPRAFLYSNGETNYLPTLGGRENWAKAINDNGQIVGYSDVPGPQNTYHAFIYRKGVMTDLGTLGGNQSVAYAVNNIGQVAGVSEITGSAYTHAFLDTGGTMTDLFPNDPFNSQAEGINLSGQVVGWHGVTYDDVADNAFLYSDGVTTNLNDLISPASGWNLIDAAGINDNRQIVCDGINSSNQYHALLLTPIPVPEPSTLALLGSTLLGLGVAYLRRRGRRTTLRLFLVAALMHSAAAVQADVFDMRGTISNGTWTGLASLSFVTVGDPGNVADSPTGFPYGSVPYAYQIGKYDVTVAQYVQFLNAVATKSDPYGLYYPFMATDMPTIHIVQSGSAPNYSYAVTGSDSQGGNCPIFDVSWGDAVRFCNWLDNGQPTSGTESTATTESGAYALNGATSRSALMAVASPAHSGNNAPAYFLPTENEWYKAAFYSGGGTNSAYYTYPTQSNTGPDKSLVLARTEANDANYYYYGSGYTDPTNYLTPVGTFAATPGPYGTYDMGGDVQQWNEAISGSARGDRGGAWDSYYLGMGSSFAAYTYPDVENDDYGFRVASSVTVPEPSSLALLLAAAAGLLAFSWRNRCTRRAV